MSTKPCPRCGSTYVPQAARFCGQCGHTFVDAGALPRVPTTIDEATNVPAAPTPERTPAGSRDEPVRPRIGMATMLGHAPIAMTDRAPLPGGTSEPAPSGSTPALGKTTFDPTPYGASVGVEDAAASAGGASPAPEPPSRPRRSPPSDKQTMLGVPSLNLPAFPLDAPPPPPSPHALPSTQKTMLGVAVPGIAPTHEPRAGARANHAATLLGVAVPGITSVHSARAPTGYGPEPSPPPPIVPAPAPLVMEPLPVPLPVPQKKGISAVVVVGIVFALVALGGAGSALYVRKSGAPLAAQPQLDETGKESLRIRCESCADGTVISLGTSSSKVQGATTQLPLPAPLSIGDNDLEMTIDRPAPGRDETVTIHVPVAYRVKADLSTLGAVPPAITVRIEALPDTTVTVEGKPVTLDASGNGAHAVDVTSDVDGPSDVAKTIDRKIPFTIAVKGAVSAEDGQLVVRTGIAPLHVDAPGPELFTDRPTGNVAGQVKSGSTVTIDGQSVAVDAQGRFGVRVELPIEGEKTIAIVASAPPLAPRTMRAKLIRVGSLDAAAKILDARSPIGFDAYGAAPTTKLGQLAVVEGEVQEIRVAQGHTVMAIEEKTSCSAATRACLVRVVHGAEVRASRGDTVRAYGRIAGTATSNGDTIPDIEGALVVPRSRPGTR